MRLLCRLRVLLLTVAALAVLQSAVHAQAQGPAIDPAAIDQIMQDALKAWHTPGAAIVIVRGDEVVYAKGFGVKEVGGSQNVTPDTLFACASTSKAFTCMGIAMLVMDGKMKWDDPVSKHIDFFHLADPLADRNVTLRDLVTHRTGLTRHDLIWLGADYSREDLLKRIGLVQLTKPFRSTYQYQNIMYLAAGYASGKANGTTWEELIQKRVFDPLGMKTANFSVRDSAKAADHATPHQRTGGKVTTVPFRNIDHIAPAGSINASVNDLSKWLRFQLGDGTFGGKQLITSGLLRETHSPQMVVPMDGTSSVTSFTREMNPETNMMNYGLGWLIQDYRGTIMISHGGSIDGFRAQVAMLPKQKIGMAILSNLGRTSLPEAVRNSVADAVLATKEKRDWNAHYLAQQEKADAVEQKQTAAFEAKRQKNTKPSRELSAYAGSFEEPAYGTITITNDNGALSLQWNKFKLRLEHWHFDTFMTKGDTLVNNKPVLFTLGTDGEIEKLSFLEQEFKKKKMKSAQ